MNAYLGLGDNEQAFYWLEQAYKEQSNILQFLKSHPYFDPIRSDPPICRLASPGRACLASPGRSTQSAASTVDFQTLSHFDSSVRE